MSEKQYVCKYISETLLSTLMFGVSADYICLYPMSKAALKVAPHLPVCLFVSHAAHNSTKLQKVKISYVHLLHY